MRNLLSQPCSKEHGRQRLRHVTFHGLVHICSHNPHIWTCLRSQPYACANCWCRRTEVSCKSPSTCLKKRPELFVRELAIMLIDVPVQMCMHMRVHIYQYTCPCTILNTLPCTHLHTCPDSSHQFCRCAGVSNLRSAIQLWFSAGMCCITVHHATFSCSHIA